jgi:RimJ/RimL family protein N-acetyltransferase
MGSMMDMSDLSQFRQHGVLRNGTPMLIRTVRADDRERLVAAFRKLDPQTVYTRYFSFRKELSTTELGRLDASDFDRFVALVVTLGSGTDETIIAAASYIVVATTGTSRRAELAFTVEEDYQGQGLASKLLALLATIARQQGMARFEADVLAGNAPMLKVFERSGLPLTKARDGGVTHIVMDLRQDGGKN